MPRWLRVALVIVAVAAVSAAATRLVVRDKSGTRRLYALTMTVEAERDLAGGGVVRARTTLAALVDEVVFAEKGETMVRRLLRGGIVTTTAMGRTKHERVTDSGVVFRRAANGEATALRAGQKRGGGAGAWIGADEVNALLGAGARFPATEVAKGAAWQTVTGGATAKHTYVGQETRDGVAVEIVDTTFSAPARTGTGASAPALTGRVRTYWDAKAGAAWGADYDLRATVVAAAKSGRKPTETRTTVKGQTRPTVQEAGAALGAALGR